MNFHLVSVEGLFDGMTQLESRDQCHMSHLKGVGSSFVHIESSLDTILNHLRSQMG